jgi:hypothetical protein
MKWPEKVKAWAEGFNLVTRHWNNSKWKISMCHTLSSKSTTVFFHFSFSPPCQVYVPLEMQAADLHRPSRTWLPTSPPPQICAAGSKSVGGSDQHDHRYQVRFTLRYQNAAPKTACCLNDYMLCLVERYQNNYIIRHLDAHICLHNLSSDY